MTRNLKNEEVNAEVIEIDKDKIGIKLTILLRKGTLNLSDIIVCGEQVGKIKKMCNDINNNIYKL